MRKGKQNEFNGVGKERTRQSGELEHDYHRDSRLGTAKNKSATPST
jgi:hypothetical protein